MHSLIHYSSPSITVTSYCLSTTICLHTLPIYSISSQTYSSPITSFIYYTSLSLPLSLDCLSLISLAILFHSLFHSIILYHSILSHTHHTIHHSTLSLLITLVSIHLLSTPYTLHYHLISFIYYSLHSTTHSSSHTSSLKTHSHYPSITLIYYHLKSILYSILPTTLSTPIHSIHPILSSPTLSRITHTLQQSLSIILF